MVLFGWSISDNRHFPVTLFYFCHPDARETSAYAEEHVSLARSATNKKSEQEFYIPFDAHLPTTNHCIVYDSNTVSIIENSE